MTISRQQYVAIFHKHQYKPFSWKPNLCFLRRNKLKPNYSYLINSFIMKFYTTIEQHLNSDKNCFKKDDINCSQVATSGLCFHHGKTARHICCAKSSRWVAKESFWIQIDMYNSYVMLASTWLIMEI